MIFNWKNSLKNNQNRLYPINRIFPARGIYSMNHDDLRTFAPKNLLGCRYGLYCTVWHIMTRNAPAQMMNRRFSGSKFDFTGCPYPTVHEKILKVQGHQTDYDQ